MIFKLEHLQGIKSGAITLAFRRWRKPMVKKGSLIKTALGQVQINDVSVVEEKSLKTKDARGAGFESIDQLIEASNKYEGDLYRISLSYYAEDPRIALREQSLTDDLFTELNKKIQRLDKASAEGPWTLKVLKAIQDNPQLRAADLSKKLGMEKMKLKLNIRKLKNLGLTISHEVGYEISSLGRDFLKRLKS